MALQQLLLTFILMLITSACNIVSEKGAVINGNFFEESKTQTPSDNTAVVNKDFVSTWRVGDAGYGDGSLSITLPLVNGFIYNFSIDWGDGSSDLITSHTDPEITHTYSFAGDYTLKISGTLEAWSFNNGGDRQKILTISSLGDLGWKSFANAFHGCTNLTTVSGGVTTNVTDMSLMFHSATNVLPDTSGWDTSNVTTMKAMFLNATSANPDTSNWNTSSVTTFEGLFQNASSANPDTSGWNTSNVTHMGGVFSGASIANPNVSGWDTSSVTTMSSMFHSASMANPDTSGWITTNVTNMTAMFRSAGSANPDTSNWDTSQVTSMSQIFFNAISANPDVSSWDISNLTSMYMMFRSAANANPDMSSWNFSGITDMSNAFTSSGLSNTNYSNMLTRIVATSSQTGVTLDVGGAKYNSGATSARASLISNSWNITDSGAE